MTTEYDFRMALKEAETELAALRERHTTLRTAAIRAADIASGIGCSDTDPEDLADEIRLSLNTALDGPEQSTGEVPSVSAYWVLHQLSGMSFPEAGSAYNHMKRCLDNAHVHVGIEAALHAAAVLLDMPPIKSELRDAVVLLDMPPGPIADVGLAKKYLEQLTPPNVIPDELPVQLMIDKHNQLFVQTTRDGGKRLYLVIQ